MRGRRARLAVATIALCGMVGCGVHSEQEAAKPLRSPGQVTDFVGIWRTIHQNVLELRQSGSLVLITSVSEAQSGNFTLDQGRITVSGMAKCAGSGNGTYRLQVAHQQKLLFSEADDPCAFRLKQLTVDPYVYSNPES